MNENQQLAETPMSLQLSICEGPAMVWHKNGIEVTKGSVVDFKDIPGGTEIYHAVYATGTDGIAGKANWTCTIGSDVLVFSFEFDMSKDGVNTGNIWGNAAFNTYFSMCDVVVPSQGSNIQAFASIQPN